MKTKILIGSMLAIAGIANAQTWVSGSGQLTTTGKVGIGTAAPSTQLHIATTGATQLFVERTAGQINGLKLFFTSNPATGILVGAGSSIFQNQATVSDMLFMSTPTSAGMVIKSGGNVGVGFTTPAYKFDVLASNTNDDGIHAYNNNTGASALFLDKVSGTTGKNWAMRTYAGVSGTGGDFDIYNATDGVEAMHIWPSGQIEIGASSYSAKLSVFDLDPNLSGSIYSASFNNGGGFGVSGQNITNDGTGFGLGVRGGSFGAATNYGGYFEVRATTGCPIGLSNIALYTLVNNPSGCTNDWAAYFDGGNVNTNGNLYLFNTFFASDLKLKKDITALTSSLDNIKQLKPSRYNFKTDEFPTMNLPKSNQIGLIAQDLEKIYPELVSEVAEFTQRDKDGKATGTIPSHKSVNYVGLIPVLIAGMQEQQKQIESQQQLIDALMNKQGTTSGIGSISSPIDGFSLDQNIPNPFSSETTINYNLPEQVQSASLIVYDLTGKQIMSMPITQKGRSSIIVTSEKLQAGIYIYSVVADGKILDSKRMVLAEK